MKRIVYTALLALSATFAQAQVKIGANPATITSGATLDVEGSSSAIRTVILNNGNVGINTVTPNAPLQFSNTLQPRKIVLWENANNDHEFYGLGMGNSLLRYQIPGSGTGHSFVSGVSSTSSTELMRIDASGKLLLPKYGQNTFGSSTPKYFLAVDANGNVVEASSSAQNIYTVDGSILSDRTVTYSGNSLNFKGSAGTFTFSPTGNTFSTSAKELILSQTADQYGSSSLIIRNRSDQAGVLVTTANLTTGASQVGVTDLFLQTSSTKQQNLRLEGRVAYMTGPYSSFGTANDTLELQFGRVYGSKNGPSLVLNDNYVLARQKMIIGSGGSSLVSNLNISAKALGPKITLFENSPTSHYGFGVANSTLTYDSPGNHIFYSDGVNGSGTEILRINNNYVYSARTVIPSADNQSSLGISNQRWSAVYAVNGTIQTSDSRLKTNIRNSEYGLKQVLKMRPVSYNWKDNPTSNHMVGFIAQEMEKIVPEAVVTPKSATDHYGMNYSELVPVLTKAIQEQQAQIEDLKLKNTFLEAKVSQAAATDKAHAELASQVAQLQDLLGVSKKAKSTSTAKR